MQNALSFNNLHQPLASTIEHGGNEYLYFGGTAYLGIPKNEKFLTLYLQGIKSFGLNNGTSRNNNIQLGIYADAEQYASSKFGADVALITSSGYLAAQLTVKQLANFGTVTYAPGTHPALWIDQKPDTAGNFTQWKQEVVKTINQSTKDKWVIISNSMNNLMPEIFDFDFIQYIDAKKQIILIVDDSHGIGVNNEGRGAFSSIPSTKNVEVVVIASMAKALGVDAGLILGSAKMINLLKQTDIFLGASPPSAAGLFAFMKADEIYKNELEALQNNMLLLNEKLAGREDWHFMKDFPVYLAKNAELSDRLLQKHILISSFAYPDKHGPKINRIVLSSWHGRSAMEKLIKAL